MIFLGLFIFVIFLVAYFRKKNTRDQEAVETAFWKRETEANYVRRKDISGLPYISIPLEKFPMNIYNNPELKELEETLQTLSAQKILNLSNQTNTDLKMQYGPANLEALSQYDQNFSTLCRTLVAYAEALTKLGYTKEAQTVLEFGIECGSDHSQNYKLLANIYHEQGATEKLSALLDTAQTLNSPMKCSIVTYLENMLA